MEYRQSVASKSWFFSKKLKKTVSSQSGWIYVDFLIGMIIVSVALTALVFAYTQATKTTVYVTDRTQAIYLARKTIESLKTEDGKSGNIDLSVRFSVPIDNIEYGVDVKALEVPAGSVYTSNSGSGRYNLQAYQVTVGWPHSDSGNELNKVQMVGYRYYVVP